MRKNIGIVGAGSWGTALAILLTNNGHNVTMWSHSKDEIVELALHKTNSKLPGVVVHENIGVTDEIKHVILNQDYIVMAVPSVATRSVAKQMACYVKNNQVIVNVAKGIEENTLMTLSSQIESEIPQAIVAVLSGPSHAEEVARGLPTTCVVGCKDSSVANDLQDVFMSDVFRVYTSSDVIGIELGGALKNVIALAAGIADGLGYGDNTKAALITRGIAEITRLGVEMGGKAESFAGLTGIGDLIVTCDSMNSRNRRAGILIGQGKTMEEAMAEVNMVVEGVYSAKAAFALSKKHSVSMPIVEQVNEVLFNGKQASDAVRDLMMRGCRVEHKALVI